MQQTTINKEQKRPSKVDHDLEAVEDEELAGNMADEGRNEKVDELQKKIVCLQVGDRQMTLQCVMMR
jgi:hypothetical protein